MTELQINNVSYGTAIRGVSENWSGGNLVGLLGPNGAGKSTLLRMIAGIWQPDAGQISLDQAGIHAMAHRQRARRIAYLPQSLPDDVGYTVREFVEMGRYPYHRSLGGLTPDCVRAVSRALTKLDLSNHADKPLARLSGGERQRVSLARLLAQETDVLLLDEPISSLDLHYQLEFLSILHTLAAEGLLVVAALHHLEFAAQFCSHVVLLRDGQNVASGAPHEVLTAAHIAQVFRTPVDIFLDPFQQRLRFSYYVPTDCD